MTDILDADTGAPFASNTTADLNSASAKTSEAAAKVREIGAKVQAKAEKAASRLSDQLNTATERTVEAYDQASRKARQVAETVDPFVREKPYAAIGAVLAAGVIIGMLLAARSPKVIYIKPGH